jgi:hypothetical protein
LLLLLLAAAAAAACCCCFSYAAAAVLSSEKKLKCQVRSSDIDYFIQMQQAITNASALHLLPVPATLLSRLLSMSHMDPVIANALSSLASRVLSSLLLDVASGISRIRDAVAGTDRAHSFSPSTPVTHFQLLLRAKTTRLAPLLYSRCNTHISSWCRFTNFISRWPRVSRECKCLTPENLCK